MAIYCTGCGTMMRLQSYAQAKCPNCGKTTTINGMTAENWDTYVPANVQGDTNCRFCILCGGEIFWSPDGKKGTCTKCKASLTSTPATPARTPTLVRGYVPPTPNPDLAAQAEARKQKVVKLDEDCVEAIRTGDMKKIRKAVEAYLAEEGAGLTVKAGCYRAVLAIDCFEASLPAAWLDPALTFNEKDFEEALALYKACDYAGRGEEKANAWLTELTRVRWELGAAWRSLTSKDWIAFCPNEAYREAKEKRIEVERETETLNAAQRAQEEKIAQKEETERKRIAAEIAAAEGALKDMQALPPVKGLFKKKKVQERESQIAALQADLDTKRRGLAAVGAKYQQERLQVGRTFGEKRSALSSALYSLERADVSLCLRCPRKDNFCPHTMMTTPEQYALLLGANAPLNEEEQTRVAVLTEMLRDLCDVIHSLNVAVMELQGKRDAIWRKYASQNRNPSYSPYEEQAARYRYTPADRAQEAELDKTLQPLKAQWESLTWRLAPLPERDVL